MLRLHAVLCQDGGTNLQHIIWPLNTHPDTNTHNYLRSNKNKAILTKIYKQHLSLFMLYINTTSYYTMLFYTPYKSNKI